MGSGYGIGCTKCDYKFDVFQGFGFSFVNIETYYCTTCFTFEDKPEYDTSRQCQNCNDNIIQVELIFDNEKVDIVDINGNILKWECRKCGNDKLSRNSYIDWD